MCSIKAFLLFPSLFLFFLSFFLSFFFTTFCSLSQKNIQMDSVFSISASFLVFDYRNSDPTRPEEVVIPGQLLKKGHHKLMKSNK